MRLLLPLFALACVPVPPSGDVLAPARVRGPTPTSTPAATTGTPSGPQGDFDFAGEDREEVPVEQDGTADPLALQAKMLGLREVPKASPRPAPEPATAPASPALPGPAAPIWDPSYPLPDASFGVRVLAVLLDMQPPRAVLGLPDGREQVVTPGAMLPTEGLVVLAIGRDAVQIAKVTPTGFYARVDTETVRALYPQPAPSAP